MTSFDKALVALFKVGWPIAQIVKVVGVDAKTVEVALRLGLNAK